jgi:hypothetical protein
MSNHTEDSSQNPFSEWIRLQMEFQARLADETLRYLRRLQGVWAPVTPGTVLLPESGTELRAEAVPGSSFEVALEVENCQRVYSVAAPVLDPLISSTGTTWYPEADFSPTFALIAPDNTIKFVARVSVPALLPAGTYIGALALRGLRQRAFLLTVSVGSDDTPTTASAPATPTENTTVESKKHAPSRAKGKRVKTIKPKKSRRTQKS